MAGVVEFNVRDRHVLGELINPPYFWGVFHNWQNVGADPFATEGWMDHCRSYGHRLQHPTVKDQAIALAKRILRGTSAPKHLVAPIKAIHDLSKRQKDIRILDVGGGFGDNFYLLQQYINDADCTLHYDVVDNARQLAFGAEFLPKSRHQVGFYESVPDKTYDLILIIGTIQYIDPWAEFVDFVSGLSGQSIFISRSPLRREGGSFVTVQSICPAFGSSASRKIGESNVTVIEENALDQQFLKNGYVLNTSKFNADYSKNFTNVPQDYQNIIYVDKEWVKKA